MGVHIPQINSKRIVLVQTIVLVVIFLIYVLYPLFLSVIFK